MYSRYLLIGYVCAQLVNTYAHVMQDSHMVFEVNLSMSAPRIYISDVEKNLVKEGYNACAGNAIQTTKYVQLHMTPRCNAYEIYQKRDFNKLIRRVRSIISSEINR